MVKWRKANNADHIERTPAKGALCALRLAFLCLYWGNLAVFNDALPLAPKLGGWRQGVVGEQ